MRPIRRRTRARCTESRRECAESVSASRWCRRKGETTRRRMDRGPKIQSGATCRHAHASETHPSAGVVERMLQASEFEIAGERGVIEAAILGRNRDRLCVRERQQVFEFGAAKSRQRHDRNRANFEACDGQGREFDAIGKLDDDAVVALDPIAREEGGEGSSFSEQLRVGEAAGRIGDRDGVGTIERRRCDRMRNGFAAPDVLRERNARRIRPGMACILRASSLSGRKEFPRSCGSIRP